MALSEFRLGNVRCLQAAELVFHPRINLISGSNGSGKTSLLEAVYLLGRGRSFRTRHSDKLIRHGADKLLTTGRLDSGRRIGVAVDRASGVEARIDAQPVGSLAELSAAFPTQVIDPGIHRLVEEGPTQRRRWLDWAVFHVEPNFVGHWQGYQRALKQRNAALRTGTETHSWDLELVRLGVILTGARARLLEALQPHWISVREALGALPISLGFFQGWSRDQGLAEALAQHQAGDRERGLTSVGPHRFDVLLREGARGIRETISRGQQKLLGAAMALTMSRYVATITGQVPTLLLDDPAAELDVEHTAALLSTVAGLEGQVLVTALRPELSPFSSPDRMFHVEQGTVLRG